MSEAITFRPRARGCATKVGDAVSYVEPKVRFVRGWLTGGVDPEDGSVECGDETLFPLEVTPAQLFEIMYRVKDAAWSAGEAVFNITVDPDPPIPFTISFTTGTPPTALLDTTDGYQCRGYVTTSFSDTADLMLSYGGTVFGAAYSPPFLTPAGEELFAREALTEAAIFAGKGDPRELGFYDMARADFSSPFPFFWDSDLDSPCRTGFSYECDAPLSGAANQPSFIPDDILLEGGAAALGFTGEVAFIDDDGTGNPLSSGNRLFIGMKFAMEGDGAGISTVRSEFAAFASGPTGTDLEFELAGGEVVSCPIYWYDIGAYDSVSFVSGTSFRITATEWWGYGGMWDPDTGLLA